MFFLIVRTVEYLKLNGSWFFISVAAKKNDFWSKVMRLTLYKKIFNRELKNPFRTFYKRGC